MGVTYSKPTYLDAVETVSLNNHKGRDKGYLFAKRLIDVVCSLFACLALFLPSLVIICLIRADSEGPALFKQERLGKNGKKFYIYKFRTMRMDAESNGPQFAKPDDVRCTKIGAFLRKMRVDEWPQFYNILKGDMSLVGPRPERAFYYSLFRESIPSFSERLEAKPGLTGFAQVYGGLHLAPEQKIEYDLYYISHCSIWLDLRCICKTFAVLIKLMVHKDEQ